MSNDFKKTKKLESNSAKGIIRDDYNVRIKTPADNVMAAASEKMKVCMDYPLC